MFRRLSGPTGSVTDNSTQTNDSETEIVRPAILVHAGPEGEALTFQSADGPITFDAARIKNVVEVHNAYMEQLSQQYGNKIPLGAYEPILDSHEDDSNNRIVGRLTGSLKYEVRDVPKVGKNVPCAVADPGITFLGRDTVERVKDGRIYHLSIGINEQDNRIGETSTVVKPAAPGAMLLKHGQTKPQVKGGNQMSVDIKRMKAHTEKMARLSAMKEIFGGFSKKLVATSEAVRLTTRESHVTHRLTTAMRGGKMTPGEYKNMLKDGGLKKLAALDDSTLAIALSPIEAREFRVIQPGQVGSSYGPDASDIARDMAKQKDMNETKRLRAEFGKTYTKMTGKKLASSEEEGDDYKKEMAFDKEKDKEKEMSGPKEAPVSVGADEHAVPGQQGDAKMTMAHHLAAMGKHLEAGNVEGAKACHAEMSKMVFGQKHMAEDTGVVGDVKSEDQQKNMQGFQMQVDELNTQMSRLAGMVEEMMSAESEEGKHFGEISDEHKSIAG